MAQVIEILIHGRHGVNIMADDDLKSQNIDSGGIEITIHEYSRLQTRRVYK